MIAVSPLIATVPSTDAVNASPGRIWEKANEFSSRTVISVPAGRVRKWDAAGKGVVTVGLPSEGTAG